MSEVSTDKKLKGKDLITIGIFSAIYFVINFAFMLLGGIHPVLWMLMPGFIAVFAGIPFIHLVAVDLYFAFYVFIVHSAPGRKLYAIGGSKEAAEVAGIPIFRYRVLAFSLCGAIAGLAGALVASRVGSANTTAGQGYFLQSYAAVFIGCTVSKSGVPCVVGTLIGAAVLAVLANGLTILQMPSFMQNIITGGIIILAVVIQKIGAGKN